MTTENMSASLANDPDLVFTAKFPPGTIRIASIRPMPGAMHRKSYALLPAEHCPPGLCEPDDFFNFENQQWLILGAAEIAATDGNGPAIYYRPAPVYAWIFAAQETKKLRDPQRDAEAKTDAIAAAAHEKRMAKLDQIAASLDAQNAAAQKEAEDRKRLQKLRDPSYVAALEKRLQALESGKL